MQIHRRKSSRRERPGYRGQSARRHRYASLGLDSYAWYFGFVSLAGPGHKRVLVTDGYQADQSGEDHASMRIQGWSAAWRLKTAGPSKVDWPPAADGP